MVLSYLNDSLNLYCKSYNDKIGHDFLIKYFKIPFEYLKNSRKLQANTNGRVENRGYLFICSYRTGINKKGDTQ